MACLAQVLGLARDKGTSQLAQGFTAHSTLAEVERCKGSDFEVIASELQQIVTDAAQ